MSKSLREQLIESGIRKSIFQSRPLRNQYRPPSDSKWTDANFSREDMEKAMCCFKHYMTNHPEQINQNNEQSSCQARNSDSVRISPQSIPKRTVPPVESFYPSESYIAAITPGAEILSSTRNDLSFYKLRTDENTGIDSRFDDDGAEVTIGLDFGTSTVKVVLKIEDDFVAVPFVLASGIDAYLLPTRLYQTADESYTLSSSARLNRSSPKLDLLDNPSDHEAKLHASIFLALVLRHIRSWFFSNYSTYDDESIAWECVIGYPSNENDLQTDTLWRELLYRSWILSVKPCSITLLMAEDIWRKPLHSFEDEISFDYFRCMPEVVAAIAGFKRNQPILDNFKGNYTLVDIGSGTVDIATFAYTKTSRQHHHNRTSFTSKVEPLGTTNCHHYRLDWLQQLLQKALASGTFTVPEKIQISKFIKLIDDEKNLSLTAPLRDSVADYLSGITIEPFMDDADNEFQKKLTLLINHVRRETVTKKFLTPNDVDKMPVFFCGGGARSRFYRTAFLEKHPNITWLAPRQILETQIIRELVEGLDVPIDRKDHDRLLIAYGLCAEEPPKMCKATPLDDCPVKEFSSFIDKDMV